MKLVLWCFPGIIAFAVGMMFVVGTIQQVGQRGFVTVAEASVLAGSSGNFP